MSAPGYIVRYMGEPLRFERFAHHGARWVAIVCLLDEATRFASEDEARARAVETLPADKHTTITPVDPAEVLCE